MPKRSNEERVSSLEKHLSVTFQDRALGLCALTHKSYANEHKGEGLPDNERLEFLGDAVVDLAISHRLMEKFPKATEGELSKLRALIVNEEALARVARRVQLGELLLLGRGEELTGGREKSSLLADALEAVLGALYLSAGLVPVMEWVDREFADALAGVAQGQHGSDYKTRLQELIQTRQKISPKYRVVSERGPEHAKIFEIEVSAGAEALGLASGRSKKEAEQAAARVALERMSQAEPTAVPNESTGSELPLEERFDPDESGD